MFTISKITENARGSSFFVDDIYVDYESIDLDLTITPVTKSLLKKGYLKLIEEGQV